MTAFRLSLTGWNNTGRVIFCGRFVVPGGSWKGGSSHAYDELHSSPRTFHIEMRQRVRWEGADKDPDDMVKTMGEVKETHIQQKAVKAVNTAAAGRNELSPRRDATGEEGQWAASIIVCTGDHEGCFQRIC